MKFVVISTGEQEYPILFPSHLIHEDIATALCGVIQAQWPDREPPKVISAGDVTVSEASVGGRSTTLDMTPRGRKDERLITMGEYTAYWAV